MFVIGQEQDALGGGFSSPESFIGQLTQLNVWSRELTLEDIESLRMSCEKKMGDVLAWTDLADKMYGAVSDSHIDFCKGNAGQRRGRRTRGRKQCFPVLCNS